MAKREPCPKCASKKTHRCKTGLCRHCDACDHAWFPGQPDCEPKSYTRFLKINGY